MPKYVAEMTIHGLNEVEKIIRKSNVLIMGWTYKENVADTRESPARGIAKELKENGIKVFGYDPMLNKKEIKDFNVEYYDVFKSLKKPMKKIDAVIITVAHDKFKTISLDKIKKIMNSKPVLVDIRRIYDKKKSEKKGFYYLKL